jgi:hypothetical protein
MSNPELVARALAIMGDRESITSGELIRRLDPLWQTRGDTPQKSMQRAGFHLSRSLGVKPRREATEFGWRSFYYREDLLAARDGAPSPAPVAPLRPVNQTTHVAPANVQVGHKPADKPSVDGLVYCGQCGKGNPWSDHPCWSCGLSFSLDFPRTQP